MPTLGSKSMASKLQHLVQQPRLLSILALLVLLYQVNARKSNVSQMSVADIETELQVRYSTRDWRSLTLFLDRLVNMCPAMSTCARAESASTKGKPPGLRLGLPGFLGIVSEYPAHQCSACNPLYFGAAKSVDL